jgi:hypothetical protein
MASIRRRNGRYHVQIRKNGYPSVTKTFIHLKTAKEIINVLILNDETVMDWQYQLSSRFHITQYIFRDLRVLKLQRTTAGKCPNGAKEDGKLSHPINSLILR